MHNSVLLMSQSDKIQSLNINHLTGVVIAKLVEHYTGIAEAGSLIAIRYFSGHFSMLFHERFKLGRSCQPCEFFGTLNLRLFDKFLVCLIT